MGVTGLWTVVQPCARPIKLETLNKKRLAVDASIWIYQFLKAVRDKEGNALRNSHVVGFFRRICKLLFVGIRPVFVFDGGAPALKRQTIAARRSRREGRREDAARTAGKLLAVQMQRRAEEEEERERERKRGGARAEDEQQEEIPENVVYADEVTMTERERKQKRDGFKKKDAYHLPELAVSSLAEMGAPNDPRIMSLEELEAYARQFEQGEDINVYDFSKIDFDSTFFLSLPATDRYNILNAARLRSRLRMGYSKDQLDSMFKDRMAFSKFQIERVRERNELTQRLMNINNGDTLYGMDAGGRVAGEKNREYVLVKNEGVEGGWALGVVDRDEGRYDKPIEVDRSSPPKEEENEEWEDEDDFEDVPIEGLNRLPRQQPAVNGDQAADLAKRRQEFYKSRQRRKPRSTDPDSLFVEAEDGDEEWENVDVGHNGGVFEPSAEDEDEELQRAIAMSLQQDNDNEPASTQAQREDDEDEFLEVFRQQKAEESKAFTKGSGLAIACMANNRSARIAKPVAESDSDDDGMNLQAALAESRQSKHKSARPEQQVCKPAAPAPAPAKPTPSPQPAAQKSSKNASGFSGPLPFEKLDLGSSLLGKKKMQKLQEEQAGGFERPEDEEKRTKPLPPWFAADRDVRDDFAEQKRFEAEQRERDRKELEKEFVFEEPPRLRHHGMNEVIDLDAESPKKGKEVIDIQSSEDEEDLEMGDVMPVDPEVRMGDLADKVRAEPPKASPAPEASVHATHEKEFAVHESEVSPQIQEKAAESEGEPIEWSESEAEQPMKERLERTGEQISTPQPAGTEAEPPKSRSTSPEFETVIENTETNDPGRTVRPSPPPTDIPAPASGLADQETIIDDDQPPDDDNESIYSDPEDEELFRQLANEATEHARFASTLNHKSQAANAADYERELTALRTQQKKDRRDADEVTQTMIAECQQLLSLFGLPYITAPMEAEAQCAELVRLGLVDGIVTDDSDIFLFGGTRVYKNMFNQAKFVECYLAHDLDAEFGLSRARLCQVAQLLGSDYTAGLPGVGPVTALEILAEFGDLAAFRAWWLDVQSGARPRAADARVPWRRRFRKQHAARLFLPPGFPDPRVDEAYLKPDVDSDATGFAWGVPDLDALRRFLMATIGWSSERTDEVLVPVIRDMNMREREGTQSNITAFLESGSTVGAGAWAPRRRDGEGAGGGGRGRGSGRLASALRGIGARAREGEGGAAAAAAEAEAEADAGAGAAAASSGAQELRDTADDESASAEQRMTRKGKKKAKRKAVVEDDEDDDGDGGEFEEDADGDAAYEEEPKKKKARKGASGTKGGRGSGGNGRGRGRGRARALNNAEFIS